MDPTPTPCVLQAWQRHEAELHGFLRQRLGRPEEAEDLLQDVFLKALRQGKGFCEIANARAWLFQVARHALIDRHRTAHPTTELPDDLTTSPAETEEAEAVEALAACLPRVLSELPAADRIAIELCDIEGLTQQAFADRLGLSLPAAKSRIQRARTRLRARMTEACKVRFDAAGKVCCYTARPPLADSTKVDA